MKKAFILKKENEGIKSRIMTTIITPFTQEHEIYKPIRVDNFWNNNYHKYESSGDRNKSH